MSNLSIPRWLSLGAAFPVIFVNGWLLLVVGEYLQPIPSIVITASLAAFLLDYPILFLERRGMWRGWAIALVVVVALVGLSIVGLFLGPILVQQLVEFANRLPQWIEQGRKQLLTLDNQALLQYLPMDINSLTAQLTNQISDALQSLTSRLIGLTLDTINSAVNLLATIVLTILLVLNGNKLWDGLMSWLPERWQTLIQVSLQRSFQGYFAGQAIIALILSVALSVAFLMLQIPFGLLFGLGIGFASIIPFGGTLAIALVSFLLAFQSIWLGGKVLITALILGQINDNIVAPRLLGGITGLNPALIIVSLLVGVKLGGILGLLLAVPAASFIKRMADALRQPVSMSAAVGSTVD